MLKKIILALFGLAFAFVITSCNDQGKKSDDHKKSLEKENKQVHSRRW